MDRHSWKGGQNHEGQNQSESGRALARTVKVNCREPTVEEGLGIQPFYFEGKEGSKMKAKTKIKAGGFQFSR
jgi:hypothetical protein